MKNICSTPPSWNFIKVSRSYVNPNQITRFSKKHGAEITLSFDNVIKVSSRIRKHVFETLQNDYNIF